MADDAQAPAIGKPAEPADAAPSNPIDSSRATSYIERRLDPQIAWFERKAAVAKRAHFSFSTTQITAMGLIPVANLLPYGAVTSTLLAALAGIGGGVAALGGHHSHWVRYRTIASALQKLRLHHEIGLPPFDGPDKDTILIAQAEALISGEHDTWSEEAKKLTADKGMASLKKKKEQDKDD